MAAAVLVYQRAPYYQAPSSLPSTPSFPLDALLPSCRSTPAPSAAAAGVVLLLGAATVGLPRATAAQPRAGDGIAVAEVAADAAAAPGRRPRSPPPRPHSPRPTRCGSCRACSSPTPPRLLLLRRACGHRHRRHYRGPRRAVPAPRLLNQGRRRLILPPRQFRPLPRLAASESPKSSAPWFV
ncbi:hypothetical protein SEVIR_9G378450v4 [Setaria viridis]|uniref:Uncharacterized protein n=1 Tax=Setaria viridis TaxID=4556 RepID=A0A4U6T259_SETVI|nr:hypothetical protein SEVIR_9G378450v2 [Setaria viridis]